MSRRKRQPGAMPQEQTNNSETAESPPREAESHLVAAGAGAAASIAGAAIGAAGGAIVGPIGAAAGAAVGAVLGGMAGKQIAESFTEEDLYFREHFLRRANATPEQRYEDYQPAYRYGWEAGERFEGTYFEEIEPELQRGWTTAKPSIPWEEARLATREAWDRRRQRLLDAVQRPSEEPEKRVDRSQSVIRDDV